MSLTPSTMVELGTPIPSFELYDTVSQNDLSYEDIAGEQATVIMFICNHCPFVKHVQEELVNIANEYIPKGVGFVAISSNDAQKYPEDSPEKMREVALQKEYPFAYLHDEDQEVAQAFNAACTPDFFVYNDSANLIYRGQLDDSRPGKGELDGKDLRAALDAELAGVGPVKKQQPSVGCSIKWKD